MQRYPAYTPSIPPPCFSLRSRRETSTTDTANTRLTEHWQTDSPALMNSYREVKGVSRYVDTNSIPSRLYREDMRQSQPYVVPSADSEQVKQGLAIDKQIHLVLASIQTLNSQLRENPDNALLVEQLSVKQTLYNLLLTQKKQFSIDAMGRNPYFDKYDVAGDSRNIVRELRTAVTEDVVDRGMKESQKLLRREMESRWVPANFAESQGIDTLAAYDLMRPKYNQQENLYRT
jgi:hypothetical protein